MTHTQLPWAGRSGVSLAESEGQRCEVCGFELWTPIAPLSVSHVGLYDDSRFPGRLIVSLNEHYEHFDETDPSLVARFVSDLQDVASVLRKMADVVRVNVAVLGNKDPHVHAHVIPRRIDDPNFGLSPWEAAPIHQRLTAMQRTEITAELKHAFEQLNIERPWSPRFAYKSR